MKNIHTFSKLNKGYQLVKSWLLAGCYGLPILITTLLLTLGTGQTWADYYYRGDKNSWGATAMTVHNSGLYEYYSTSAQSFNGDKFKISKTDSGWDYNYSYVAKGFNGGSNNIGDWSSDNCYIWDASNGFIIVYYPNTAINTTSNPKITFRTSLYSPTFYIKHTWNGSSWTWATMSRTETGVYTYTGNCYTSNGANVYTSQSDNNYLSPSGTSGVNNGVPAVWTYNAKTNSLSVEPAYTLTVNAGSNGTASGSVTKGIKMSTAYSISATPNSGYQFKNWTVVSGTASFASSTSASTTVTVTGNASAVIQANFEVRTGGIITMTAGTGGQVSNNGSSWAASATITNITSATDKTIYARANTGYTFSTWTKTSGSGTIKTNAATGTFTPVAYEDAAITASFSEIMSTLATSNHYDAGNPSYAVPTKSVSSIGVSTTANLTATAAGTGYTFVGWTLTHCIRTDANAANSRTITIRSDGSGSAATAVANYEEVLTSDYYLEGDGDGPFGGWTTTGTMMTKKTGASTASDVYFEITVTADQITPAGGQWAFKIYKSEGNKWFGWGPGEGGSLYWLTKENNSVGLHSSEAGNILFKPYIAGTYEFHLDYSNTTNPTITVTWPTVNQLQIYSANESGTGDDAIGNWSWDGTAGTIYSKALTLQAKTQYKFKVIYNSDFYGFKTADNPTNPMTIADHTDWRLYDDGDDCYLYAPVTGSYTFNFNSNNSGNTTLTVDFPEASPITYGVGTLVGGGAVTASPAFDSGDYIAKTQAITFTAGATTGGYAWKGWYNNEAGTGDALGTGNTYTSAAGTRTNNTPYAFYACYQYASYTITLDKQTSTTGYGAGGTCSNPSVTYNTALPAISGTMPSGTGAYGFDGFYTEAGGSGVKLINSDGTWVNNVTGYTSADGKWMHTSAITLYAYYKQAEITSFTGLSAAYQPGATEEGVTANISPSPAGTTIVCWRVLYAENDDPIASQPTFTEAGANTVRFNMPEISGNYKLEATLRLGSTCGAGTVLSTYTQQFNVAGSHNVTIQYKCGDVVIKESTIQSVAAFEATAVTAPDIVGYTFSSWTLGEGVRIAGGTLTSSPISVTAIYTSTITANYTPKRMIYFKNTIGWSGVTVYFYKNDSYWNASNGTGSSPTDTYTNTPFSEQKYGVMTQIPGTDIYYFDAEGAGVNASYTNVAFTEDTQYDYHFFYDTKVARRGDYKSSLPMFVPLEQTPVSMNEGHAKYYSEGYWMNYPENTGYKLRIYPAWNSDNASGASREYYFPYSADLQMPLKLDVELNTTEKIWFMVYRNDNVLMGKNYSVTQDNHETKLDKPSDQKLELNPSASGVYSFTLTFHDDGGSPKNYDYYINVDYPVSLGDYRIHYTDNATWSQGSAHAAGWHHTSDAIRKNTGSEEKSDTVSLFVSYGSSPSAKFQYVSAIAGSTVTWTDVPSGTVDLSGITEKGVYNFIVSQPAGGESIELSKTEEYTGNFYIRTDCAGNTKWDNFRARDHEMTYTEFSMSEANSFGEKFSHYFAHWCPAGTNVKFCIANDYSTSISDTLTQDVDNPYANIDAGGFLLSDGNSSETANRYSANIRFMYNETTNKISRAYVASSTNPARKFLILKGEGTSGREIKDENNVDLNDAGVTNGAILHDNENFIYERVIYVKPGTRFKLFACYAEVTPTEANAQYFRGAYDSNNFTTNSNSVVLLGGEGDAQKLRVIYDFKTNRLVAAWMPSDVDVSGVLKIDADVMILRDHQEAAKCITFANAESKLDGIKTVYGAMKFNRWTLNNRARGIGGVEDNDKDHCDTPADITMYHGILSSGEQKSIYERSLYFISFPFNVKVSEIFGFGHYWDEWYLEYYDGLTRAKNGYWLDSPSNWKYVTPEMAEDFVLEANKGYILGLDLDYMEYDNTTFWANNISNVELYFPSTVSVETLQSTNCTIPALNTIEGDPYRCTINRGTAEGDRRIKDSYWRCLGVPSFNLYNSALKDGNGNTITWKTNYNWVADDAAFPFLYAWNMTDNSLTVQETSAFNFKPMHAYLAQIPGEIRWTAVSAKPSSIVARQKNSETNVNHEWRLELQKDSTFVDQTYVRMSNLEQVTDTFDFGQDLVKELNATRSNIYTFVGYERLAANSMPLETEQTTIVPLGLNIKTAGDYTFAMPNGTNGVGVTLVDTEANVRTSLSALDYTVNLAAGQYDSRFVLEISPVQEVITDIEPTSDSSLKGRAQKKMIDGILYIVRDGKIYDARGARIE